MFGGIERWLTGPAHFLAEQPGQSQKTHRCLSVHRGGGKLGVCFFCSRDFEGRREIFPTLAFQYPRLRKELFWILKERPNSGQEHLCSQIEKLTVGPLPPASQLSSSLMPLKSGRIKNPHPPPRQYPPPRGLESTAMFEHTTRSAGPRMRWMLICLPLGEGRRPRHSTRRVVGGGRLRSQGAGLR